MAKRVRKARKPIDASEEKDVHQGVPEAEVQPPRDETHPGPAEATTAARAFPRQLWLIRGGAAFLAALLVVWALSGEDRLGTPAYLGLAILLMIGCGSLGFLLARHHRSVTTEVPDIDALRSSARQIRQSYNRDALTGLNSRWSLERRLLEEIERSRRYGHSFGLIIIRTDRTLGSDRREQSGPSPVVLPAIGEAIRSSARKVDFAARYSHDSFAILTPETGRAGVETLAARSTKALARITLRHEGSTFRPRPAVSYGIALFPEDGTTVCQLLDVAEGQLRQEERLAA